MTPVKTEGGFTIIEVILFLALSGLVFIIGFMGIGGRNQQVQFNDSIRSLDSYLQGQLNDVVNGINDYGAGSSGGEVLLGKVISFPSPRIVQVDTMVGDRLSASDILDRQGETDPDRYLVFDSNPRSVGTSQNAIDWGTEFHSANIGADNLTNGGFAIMRSPNSSRIFPIAFDTSVAIDFNSAAVYDPDSSVYGYQHSPDIYICLLGSNDQYATISFAAGSRQTSFETVFDPVNSPKTGNVSCGPTV